MGTKDWDAPKSLYEMFDIQEEMEEVVKKYVNDYKIHVIIPNEIEDFNRFSTELGYCLRYIQSSKNRQKLTQLLKEHYDVYSNFDKMSGNLLQIVTNTTLPEEAKKEESVNMCQAIEEMIKEEMEESAKRYFQVGGTVEIALKVFPALTEEELIAIKEEV